MPGDCGFQLQPKPFGQPNTCFCTFSRAPSRSSSFVQFLSAKTCTSALGCTHSSTPQSGHELPEYTAGCQGQRVCIKLTNCCVIAAD